MLGSSSPADVRNTRITRLIRLPTPSTTSPLKPDLILMDLSLPGMDGWEATRQLKADERTQNIPVVALTGHALAGASDGAKRAGCDSFVTKPCLPDDLVVEVRRMLQAVKQG